jgi:plasmid maintenance system antidote protein VapI
MKKSNPKKSKLVETIFEEAKQRSVYWEEMAIVEFTEALIDQLEKQKIARQDWAKALKVSPSQVTKLLAGKNNFELRTMVKLARSLNRELKFQLRQEFEACKHDRSNGQSSVVVAFMVERKPLIPISPVQGLKDPAFVKHENFAAAA